LQPGCYATVHIIGVPESLNKARQLHQPLVLVGLLPHEQKMSVLNFVIRRPNVDKHNQQIIKSKEQLIFHCGYRRFKACPIFSQHTNGYKHKVSTSTSKILDLAQHRTAWVSYYFAVAEIVPDI
jgi:pre-rRNA-processing protein TSR1